MKKMFLSAVVLFACTAIYSQSPLPVGKAQINFGVAASQWGVPVYAGVDVGIHRDVTIGGELSYRSWRENWKNDYYRHGILGISGNGNYHFNTLLNIPTKYDFYAGLSLGFYSWSSPDGYKGDYNSGVALDAQVGGRYYFNNKVGLNVELRSDNAVTWGPMAKVGLSIKL